jgi:geranylgeranylglycerol-phosphate geranylgeranyltransferase
VGNLIVALVLGLALVYGGWMLGPLGPVLVGAAFAFLTTLAREITKDVEDAEGDAAAGARTLPVMYGSDTALRIVLVILIITLLLTPLPYFLLDFVGLYLLAMLVTDALLLRACWLLSGSRPEAHARPVSNVLKSAMATGMVALALGALVQLG